MTEVIFQRPIDRPAKTKGEIKFVNIELNGDFSFQQIEAMVDVAGKDEAILLRGDDLTDITLANLSDELPGALALKITDTGEILP